MNSTDNKIDEAYNKLISTAENITEENLEASKKNIEEIKNDLSDELNSVEINNSENSSDAVNTVGTYNPITGNIDFYTI